MDILDGLKTSLLDLHRKLRGRGIRLILGGGYGLFLKQRHLRAQNVRTRLSMDMWPEARSTSDLDVFLRAEVVTDSKLMGVVRKALDDLDYRVVEEAKFYQFIKELPRKGHVKLDLLVGPLGTHEGQARRDKRRVHPIPSVDLHAHPVDEALCVEEACMEIAVDGHLSTGEDYQGCVFVPQGFSYLLMKLFAFRDRKDDDDKDMGRHHSLDILRIVAMMTQEECQTTLTKCREYSSHNSLKEARRIVREHFADEESIGVLRMREHPLFRREIDLEAFLEDLHSFFAP